jgi:transcriptional regulator with XRE-family HTH domain
MDEYLPLSQQVKILFDAVRHEDGQPFTLQEVSDATGVSLGTIGQMRSGKINNPQLNTLRALCGFFRVPLRYFETQTAEQCYTLLTKQLLQEQPKLNEIAFRASGLSEEAQQDILTLIKVFQEEEKLQGRKNNLIDDTSGNANSDAR